jgi:hypothetical protein
MATAANAKFTVLVEIKRPDTMLVGNTYRNKVHLIGEDVIGGVAQLQSNCRTWATEGASQPDNRDELEGAGIFTFDPKGILVVGNTKQLNDRHKRATFQLFRRQLQNPEILTFDELLERARLVVAVEADRTQLARIIHEGGR